MGRASRTKWEGRVRAYFGLRNIKDQLDMLRAFGARRQWQRLVSRIRALA